MKMTVFALLVTGSLLLVACCNTPGNRTTIPAPDRPGWESPNPIVKTQILVIDSFVVEYGNYYSGETGTVSSIGKIFLFGQPTSNSNPMLERAVLLFWPDTMKRVAPKLETINYGGKRLLQVVIHYPDNYMGAVITGLVARKTVPGRGKVFCSYSQDSMNNRYADLHWFGLDPVKGARQGSCDSARPAAIGVPPMRLGR